MSNKARSLLKKLRAKKHEEEEENVRQLLSYYNKKYPQNKNYSNNLMK